MSEKIYTFIEAKKLMAEEINRRLKSGKTIDERIEIKVQPMDALSWLNANPSSSKIYGANQSGSAVIAGLGEACVIKGNRTGKLEDIFNNLRAFLKPSMPYRQWYGGFCFDEDNLDRNWKAFGAYRFVLPLFELAFDGGRMIFCCNLIGRPVKTTLLRQLNALKVKGALPAGKPKVIRRRDFPSQLEWKANVNQVLAKIDKAQYQKVVLARQINFTFKEQLNPWMMLRQLIEVTPNSYHFCFQFGTKAFLGASPERLYRRQGRKIESEAIAGTIRRGKDAKEDEQLKAALKVSDKNNHEHALVVRTIHEGLEPLTDQLTEEALPQIISLGNGHHLRTGFDGILHKEVRDEKIIKALHPTPAVGALPKNKAKLIIRSLEGFSRGWFAAPLGYVGLDWTELVVGIRSALVSGKNLTVYAGAGVVEGSEPESEWMEIEHKISNFLKIIS